MSPMPYQINQFVPDQGGYFAGAIRMHDALFGVITAPKAEGEYKGIWLPEYVDVPGAASFFDSRGNTIAMAEAGSEIAKRALASTINGHSDWAIPARDVLEVQYRAHKPSKKANHVYRSGDNPSSAPAGYPYTASSPAQCADPLFMRGGQEAFEEAWYLSSTQSSPYSAWGQYFDVGHQYTLIKDSGGVVRLVRLIQLVL